MTKQKLWWIFKKHWWLNHDAAWFACGKWVTSVECYTCNRRWEA